MTGDGDCCLKQMCARVCGWLRYKVVLEAVKDRIAQITRAALDAQRASALEMNCGPWDLTALEQHVRKRDARREANKRAAAAAAVAIEDMNLMALPSQVNPECNGCNENKPAMRKGDEPRFGVASAAATIMDPSAAEHYFSLAEREGQDRVSEKLPGQTLSREEEIVIADAAGILWRKTEQPCIKTPAPAPTKVPDGKCDGVDGGGGAARGQMDSKLVPDEAVDSIEEK